MNSASNAEVRVWYDSQCPLCLREISLMRRLDKRGAIDFVDVYRGDCPLDTATMLARFHAQEPGGPLVSGAEAFAAMWRAIPVLRPVGKLARFKPVLWILELGYRFMLLIRPSVQRLVRRIGVTTPD